MTDAGQEWLNSLKAGDDVAVKEDGRYSIHRIVHVTTRQVETKYHKFSRKSGWMYNGCVTIHPVTPELKQSIEDAFERKRLRGVISLALPTASADTLRAMVRALQSATEDKHEEPINTPESGRRWRPSR